MNDDVKPEWKHKISLADFRRMYLSWVTKITHHSVTINGQVTDNYVMFHDKQGSFKAPPHWHEYFTFTHNDERLIVQNFGGWSAARDEMKIAQWEKRNDAVQT